MKMSSAFPSKYLAADTDIPGIDEGGIVLAIRHVEMELVGQGEDSQNKPVVYFDGQKKGMVLNKTNGNTLAKLLGDDTDEWEGKRVKLGAVDVEYQGRMVRGIRVSSKLPAEPAPAPARTAAKPQPSPPAAADVKDDDIPF